MASESLQCKVLALRVSIHCEGCKKKVKKVKKVLQRVEGVYRCDVDGRSNKATVTVTGKVSADTLVRKLRRAGKHAEQWPEEQKQPRQPSGGQCQEETKNQAAEPGMSGEPAEPQKPASGDATEPSNPEEPKKVSGEGVAAPAEDGGTECTDANVSESAGDGCGDGCGVETVTAQQPSEPKRRRKQQPPQQQEEKAGEATMATAAAAASTQGCHTSHFPAAPLQQQQPVHVMSYNVARPSSSAAYYAAAPVAVAPESAARPPPPLPPPSRPQEHSYAYSPYYSQSQPSPYRYGGYYSYYYYGGGGGQRTPQRSAASPARKSYGDLFSDDNANSCSVM